MSSIALAVPANEVRQMIVVSSVNVALLMSQ